MHDAIYNTLRWRIARSRAIDRDASRCTVSRLLGGECSPGPLHVHHIVPVGDGGARYDLDNLGTTCSRHHPVWEKLRRDIVASRFRPVKTVRCRHTHRSAEARAICERRLARQAAGRQVAA